MRRRLRLALALAAFPAAAACGPPKEGVGVAPLRPGPPQIRYEQTRPSMGGLLTIRIVAPESRERKVERTLEKAFAAAGEWEALLPDSKPGSPVDVVAGVLREEGFDDFAVELSGDAYFAGDAGGEAWKAAIEDPRGPRGTVAATISVRDAAVGSSGLSAVTVLARDVTTADAAGAAALAAGPVDGLALLRARGLDAILISSPEEGRPAVMTVTDGLKDVLDVSAWKGEIQWVARGH